MSFGCVVEDLVVVKLSQFFFVFFATFNLSDNLGLLRPKAFKLLNLRLSGFVLTSRSN